MSAFDKFDGQYESVFGTRNEENESSLYESIAEISTRRSDEGPYINWEFYETDIPAPGSQTALRY